MGVWDEQLTNSNDSNHQQNDPYYCKLKEDLVKAKDLNAKSELIFHFWGDNRGTKMGEFTLIVEDLLKEAELKKNCFALGWCYFTLAWIKSDYDHYEESTELFVKAQEYFKECNEPTAAIRALNGEATAYMRAGYYGKAIERYLRGLEWAEERKNSTLINIFAGNIGILLVEVKQYDEAIKYFSLAQEVKREPTAKMAFQVCNIARAYRCLGDYSQAEAKILEALRLCDLANNKYSKASCILEMGTIRQKEGKTLNAERFFKRCLELSKEIGLQRTGAIALLQLGEIEKTKGNLTEALKYFKLANEVFQVIKARSYEVQALFEISTVYETMGDFASAYSTLKKCKALEDQVFSEETINKLGVLKIQQARNEGIIYKNLYNRINSISQIGQAITSTFDLEEIGEMIYKHIKNFMDVNTLAIGLYGQVAEEMLYKICIKQGRFLPEFTVKISDVDESICSCLLENKAVVFNDLASTQTLRKDKVVRISSSNGDGVRSLLCVPMTIRSKNLGVIIVQSSEKNAYLPHHLDIMKALAAYAAIALENEKFYSYVKELATKDSLTNLPNRRRVFEQANNEFLRFKRYNKPLSIIMIDIDDFKLVNDKYGHASGDLVLKEIARIFLDSIRSSDIVGRIGGEEFLFILPSTNCNDASYLAERLRKKIFESDKFLTDAGQINISISVGVTELKEDDFDISIAINRADKALYMCKEEGGNCIEII